MPRHANQTSFAKGHYNPEHRKKQSETLKRLYAEGSRTPPSKPWTPERRERYLALAGTGALDTRPIGSTRLTKCGIKTYRMIKVSPGRNGWKYEHRHVMEQALGRQLLRSEHVHHENLDTLDNRIENLKLIPHGSHSALHHAGITSHSHSGGKLPEGRWSRKYECCTTCGLTTSPHASRGTCHRCEQRRRRNAG
jgi:hypothetical protein